MNRSFKINDETKLEFEGSRLVKINGRKLTDFGKQSLYHACLALGETVSKIDPRGASAYIDEAIASFDGDPADSDFQRGYLAALYVVGREALGMEIEDPSDLPTPPVTTETEGR